MNLPQGVLDAAREQRAEYVRSRTTERGQSYVGVLTDGRKWLLYHAIFDGSLEEVSSLEIAGGEDAARLASWLEIVLATTDKIAPIPKEIVRRRIVDEGLRIDGRGPRDLRPVSAEVGVLPAVHGSGLFQRGETQVLNVLTLGLPKMDQMLDTIDPVTKKVLGYKAANVEVKAPVPPAAAACAADPQWQRAAQIVDDAVAYAKPIAAQPDVVAEHFAGP